MTGARSWTRVAIVVGAIVTVHIVVIAWFVLSSPDGAKSRASASASDDAAATSSATSSIATPPRPSLIPTPVASLVAATDASATAIAPEPIEELAAFFRSPPGAAEWTPEERRAYRQKLVDDLDARERTLEAELRAAERAGDKTKAEQKRVTLASLRSRRAAIDSAIGDRVDASR
jgi:hypothetical protein